MKHRDLTSRLSELGWWQVSNKGPHEKWTNGMENKAVPRHKEINEFTAQGIIRFAEKNPPKSEEEK
jgi:predicted RNA binding protein YcfA (HicA-like mRNA interferase family)